MNEAKQSRRNILKKTGKIINSRKNKLERRGKILIVIFGLVSLALYIYSAYCGISNTNLWMTQLNNNTGSHRAPNWYHIGSSSSIMFSVSTFFLIPWQKFHNQKASRAFAILHFVIPMAIMVLILLFGSNR